jgi:23S rRNA (guanosine2251-2'-O)-methyltransferase
VNGAITGFHAIEEALKRANGGTLLLAGDRPRHQALRSRAREGGVRVVTSDTEELTRMAGTSDHRGAVYLPAAPHESSVPDLQETLARIGPGPRLVVVLDHVQDPHNLGAILRTSDQFAVDLVLLPGRRAAQVTPAVARVSAGASSHVPTLVIGNVANGLRRVREAGFWVYGAQMHGERIDRVRFSERTAIVMGAEGRGLAGLTARDCDVLVRIPGPTPDGSASSDTPHVDSLNVSVAAGILMYEVRRTQGYFGDVVAGR